MTFFYINKGIKLFNVLPNNIKTVNNNNLFTFRMKKTIYAIIR